MNIHITGKLIVCFSVRASLCFESILQKYILVNKDAVKTYPQTRSFSLNFSFVTIFLSLVSPLIISLFRSGNFNPP